jgi:hypothetical protein
MAAAIRGALDMLLDDQHVDRYRWDQLHIPMSSIPRRDIMPLWTRSGRFEQSSHDG